MRIIPLNHYLVVRKMEVETKTASGLYLPAAVAEAEKAAKSQGTVVEVNKDAPVSRGDTVVYRKWSEDEFKIDGETLFFITEEDLMAQLID
jgi:chaperonin GroES